MLSRLRPLPVVGLPVPEQQVSEPVPRWQREHILLQFHHGPPPFTIRRLGFSLSTAEELDTSTSTSSPASPHHHRHSHTNLAPLPCAGFRRETNNAHAGPSHGIASLSISRPNGEEEEEKRREKKGRNFLFFTPHHHLRQRRSTLPSRRGNRSTPSVCVCRGSTTCAVTAREQLVVSVGSITCSGSGSILPARATHERTLCQRVLRTVLHSRNNQKKKATANRPPPPHPSRPHPTPPVPLFHYPKQMEHHLRPCAIKTASNLTFID